MTKEFALSYLNSSINNHGPLLDGFLGAADIDAISRFLKAFPEHEGLATNGVDARAFVLPKIRQAILDKFPDIEVIIENNKIVGYK